MIMKQLLIKLWIILFIIFILIFSSIQTINTWYVWVKYITGKAQLEELQPWFHFILPIFQSIKEIDVRVRTINYNSSTDVWESWNGILNKKSITVTEKRSLPIDVDLTILYRLKESEVAESMYEYWENIDDKLVNPTARDVVREIFWNYEAEAITNKRAEIAWLIKESILKQLKDTPIEVESIQLRNVKLPDEVLWRMLEVQKENQAVEIAKKTKEKAEIEAEKKKIEAEGIAQAKIEEAKWEAEARKLQAQAEAEAIRMKYEAEAKWYELLNQSISPIIVNSKIAENWDWKMPTIVSNGNMLLPTNVLNQGQ